MPASICRSELVWLRPPNQFTQLCISSSISGMVVPLALYMAAVSSGSVVGAMLAVSTERLSCSRTLRPTTTSLVPSGSAASATRLTKLSPSSKSTGMSNRLRALIPTTKSIKVLALLRSVKAARSKAPSPSSVGSQ